MHSGRFLRSLAVIAVFACAVFNKGFAAETPLLRQISLQDALRIALKQNPSTLLQQQEVNNNRGLLLQAQSQFDPVASVASGRTRDLRSLRQDEITALQLGGVYSIQDQIVDTTTHRVGIDKTLMNGVAFGTGVSVTKIDDSAQRLTNIQSQTSGRLSFSLRVPLLRNSGTETVGAQVAASDAELSAAMLDLLHVNSQTVFNTAVAYWDTVARRKRLDIAVNAEKRALELVDETRKLIAADQSPAADIDLVVANRAEKTTARVAAEQALIDAQRVFARQLGLSTVEMSALPDPVDPLPGYNGQPVEVVTNVERLVRAAIVTRADLEAIRKREAAAQFRLVAARNNLKPQLDLNFNISYAGLAEGAPATALDRAYFSNRSGPSVASSLSLQWPFNNSQARGVLLSQAAVSDASIIRLQDLEATIAGNVSTLSISLVRSVAQLLEGNEAVRRYTATMQNELTKRRLGLSTLLDVVNIEDRQNNALLNEVQLQQNYANAIAQLRFELGMLVKKRDDVYDVSVNDLLSPAISAPDK